MLTKIHGAKASTLPILFDRGELIQGSGLIIDWAEAEAADPSRSLTLVNPEEARVIERRADEVIGVHVRRLAFTELLPRHAHIVKAAMFYRASGWRRTAGDFMWPVSRRIIQRIYDTGPGAAEDSRAQLEAEFDWLDAKLADGRPYLAGDRFSRADLTVASLLANFARPRELAPEHGMEGPATLAACVERWRERPVMRFVREMYRLHRGRVVP